MLQVLGGLELDFPGFCHFEYVCSSSWVLENGVGAIERAIEELRILFCFEERRDVYFAVAGSERIPFSPTIAR